MTHINLHSTLRTPIAAARTRLLATPHWQERLAAGVIDFPLQWLTDEELRVHKKRATEISALRGRRACSGPPSTPEPRFIRATRWRGITLYAICDRKQRTIRYAMPSGEVDHALRQSTYSVTGVRSKRQAVRIHRRDHRISQRIGQYVLRRHYPTYRSPGKPWKNWSLVHRTDLRKDTCPVWSLRPSRNELAETIRRHRAALPDFRQPDTLGWRYWYWDGQRLISPQMRTPWHAPELYAQQWDTDLAIRGMAGIHALRMPRNWHFARWSERVPNDIRTSLPLVTGVVERYRRYVLGRVGWRAEWVIIRMLQAPTPQIQAALLGAYPELAGHIHLSPDCDWRLS